MLHNEARAAAVTSGTAVLEEPGDESAAPGTPGGGAGAPVARAARGGSARGGGRGSERDSGGRRERGERGGGRDSGGRGGGRDSGGRGGRAGERGRGDDDDDEEDEYEDEEEEEAPPRRSSRRAGSEGARAGEDRGGRGGSSRGGRGTGGPAARGTRRPVGRGSSARRGRDDDDDDDYDDRRRPPPSKMPTYIGIGVGAVVVVVLIIIGIVVAFTTNVDTQKVRAVDLLVKVRDEVAKPYLEEVKRIVNSYSGTKLEETFRKSYDEDEEKWYQTYLASRPEGREHKDFAKDQKTEHTKWIARAMGAIQRDINASIGDAAKKWKSKLEALVGSDYPEFSSDPGLHGVAFEGVAVPKTIAVTDPLTNLEETRKLEFKAPDIGTPDAFKTLAVDEKGKDETINGVFVRYRDSEGKAVDWVRASAAEPSRINVMLKVE